VDGIDGSKVFRFGATRRPRSSAVKALAMTNNNTSRGSVVGRRDADSCLHRGRDCNQLDLYDRLATFRRKITGLSD